MKNYIVLLISACILLACEVEESGFDASGAFEAEETIISSEAMGKIIALDIKEGQLLKAGQSLGFIDSSQLSLKKKQLHAQMKAVLSNAPDVAVQLSSLRSQLSTLNSEKGRMERLLKDDVATQKQLDDLVAQIEIVNGKLDAAKSTLSKSSLTLANNAEAIALQIEQLDDQIEKCKIVNPLEGTVLSKYAMANEVTAPAKPLYKIADLSNMILRAYVTGDQLANLKLNQEVNVMTDDGEGGFNETVGVIGWINSKAEFTPKTIQTKDERANLVYAIKVRVKNPGTLKIGMYGEINFNK